jgi:UDP-glucose 4-epimerase
MRWLITGGCGFIGRNLLVRASQNSDAVFRVVDDLSTGTREELALVMDFCELDSAKPPADWSDWSRAGVELIRADVRDSAVALQVTTGADVAVHLAANTGVGPSIEDPMRDCTINVVGTLTYLEACRLNGVRRFVFASSSAVVGETEPPFHEELASHPASPYGASKLAGEAYCQAYARSFGLETAALRFGNCYGPLSGHKSSVVAKFIREAFTGKYWEIYGNGQQTRDFIYVDDVIDAIVLAGTTDSVGGEIFQIASSTETAVSELASKLAGVLKSYGIRPPDMRHAKTRVGDVVRNYSDTTKARTRLGWSPKVSLDEGLDRTVRWFLDTQYPGIR